MGWLSYLLILICPLMMIFYMRGHGGGHNHNHHNHNHHNHNHHNHHDHNISKTMDTKFKLQEEENRQLKDKIETISNIVKMS